MRITHPQAPFQGVAPENVFFVANDQQVQLGTGYVMQFFQGEMYPERPNHLFIQIDAQPSARALMFGALLARADQLRAATPNLPARMYAQVAPENLELLRFYDTMGLRNDDGEDLFRFLPPDGVPRTLFAVLSAFSPPACAYDPETGRFFFTAQIEGAFCTLTFPDAAGVWQLDCRAKTTA